MITKKQALYLLEDGHRSGPPALVHGTSVEAVIKMLETGVLPQTYTLPNTPPDWNYTLGFPCAARKKSFVGHALYGDVEQIPEHLLEDEEKALAIEAQQIQFASDQFGFVALDPGPEDWLYFNVTEMAEAGVDVDKVRAYGSTKLKRSLDQSKGVCVGLNHGALELPISLSAAAAVQIDLSGLPIKYVQHVFPFGKQEDQKLRAYIDTLPDTAVAV